MTSEPIRFQLPNVDIFRQPFVEPLGHLVLAWSRLELTIIHFFGLITTPEDERHVTSEWSHKDTAKLMRHWGNAKLADRIAALHDDALETEVSEAWSKAIGFQKARNRLIHDVIDVGIFEKAERGWGVQAILGPNLQDPAFNPHNGFPPIGASEVAGLACLVDELRKDFEDFIHRLPGMRREEELPPPSD